MLPGARGVHWAGQPMGPTSRRFLWSGYPTQRSNLHTLDQVNPAQGEQKESNGSQWVQLDVFTMDNRDQMLLCQLVGRLTSTQRFKERLMIALH